MRVAQMGRASGRVMTLAALVAPLAWLMAFAAAPVGAQVKDNAKIFSDAAIQEANDRIEQIKKSHSGHTLMVETYPQIPDELQSDASAQGNQFFPQWAQKRGKELGMEGVFLLICMKPAHFEIAIGDKTSQWLFAPHDRELMTPGLRDALGKKQYDDALLRTVKYVQKHMDQNAAAHGGSGSAVSGGGATGGGAASPTGGGAGSPTGGQPGGNFPYSTRPSCGGGGGMGTLICMGVGVLIVIMVVRGLFRGRAGGYGPGSGGPGNYPQPGGGYGPGPGYGGGRGGGFGTGLLGGLLGGALGGWAQDKFSHRDQGSAGPLPGGGAGDSGGSSSDPGHDTGFSSSGSDFGSDSSGSSGADFGSSSGGDFGGGGGGSDSGGGGGDSGGSDF